MKKSPATESAKARQAKDDYIKLGPNRSLEKLLARYRSTTEPPPTTRISTLKGWSCRFGWVDAAIAYDEAERERAKREAIEVAEAVKQRRIEVLSQGFALDFVRVDALQAVASRLLLALNAIDEDEEGNQLYTFNEGMVRQLRGLLEDIAKETGGRRDKIDVEENKVITVKVIKGVSLDDL